MPPVRKTHRREIIEFLLDHLTDYEPAPKTGAAFGSDDGDVGYPNMPGLYWAPSVQELYRTLDRLALEPAVTLEGGRTARGATVRAHLLDFYRSDTRINRGSRVRRWDKRRARFELVDRPSGEWKRERVVSPWIILPLVDAGVVFVDDHFEGEPFVPKEYLAAA